MWMSRSNGRSKRRREPRTSRDSYRVMNGTYSGESSHRTNRSNKRCPGNERSSKICIESCSTHRYSINASCKGMATWLSLRKRWIASICRHIKTMTTTYMRWYLALTVQCLLKMRIRPRHSILLKNETTNSSQMLHHKRSSNNSYSSMREVESKLKEQILK